MKQLFTLVVLLWALNAGAQRTIQLVSMSNRYIPSNHATFVGVSVGTNLENYVRIEHDVRDHFMILQASLYAGPEDYGIQYKMGAGYVGDKWRIYGYMPYFNYSLKDHGYNTPFSVEAFFHEDSFQASLNLDIYTAGVVLVPSVRIRYRIFKFKL